MTPPNDCPFCFPAEGRIAFESRLTIALWDAFPVSEGTCSSSREGTRDLIASRHSPDGFNIGVNVGEAAGQPGVNHAAGHLPRLFRGDSSAE